MKKALVLVLVLAISLGMFAGCGGNNGTGSSDNGADGKTTIAVNVGPEPETIDPALNTAVDGGTLINHAFEGLMKLNEEGIPVEAQAESYTVSEDGLTYTFTLRDDIKWSDGEPVTAHDFEYAWRRAIDPATASDYSYMFDVIKGVAPIINGEDGASLDDVAFRAIDEKTLEVTLVAQTPYFLELLAFPTYLPVRQDVVEGNEGWATDPETYISNGPYKLQSWVHDSEMVYVKNEEYYDVDKLGPDEIKFILMSDQNAILSAYQNGEILFADDMPIAEIDAWRDSEDMFIEGQLGTYFLCFNTNEKPFDDPKVRHALSLVIDRNFIVENISKKGEQPATAFVPTGLSDVDPDEEFRDVGGDYYSVDPADYEDNVKKAQELLAEAGYPNGEGFPKLEYMYNESDAHRQIGEALQNMWKEHLGIDSELVSQEWAVFIETRNSGNYQVARHGWLGDYNDPISFIDMWTTTSGNNDAKWSNAQYDKLVSEVKSSDDREERFAKMHEAEDILMEELPVAPIYYYVDLYLKSPKLEGFYSSPLGFKYFTHVTVSE